MNKEIKILIVIAAIILAWWFRYDLHCVQGACIAYDRFTGTFILPNVIDKRTDN